MRSGTLGSLGYTMQKNLEYTFDLYEAWYDQALSLYCYSPFLVVILQRDVM